MTKARAEMMPLNEIGKRAAMLGAFDCSLGMGIS